MDIHTTEAIAVLRRKGRMTIPQIGEQAALAYEALYAEAMARQLVVNGPPLFVAQSMPRDAHTEFDLDFCLPVASDEPPALPALCCARLMYEGPLAELFTGGYQPLLQAMAAAGLRASGESREIYHAWHGPESADNQIEIQIGIVHA